MGSEADRKSDEFENYDHAKAHKEAIKRQEIMQEGFIQRGVKENAKEVIERIITILDTCDDIGTEEALVDLIDDLQYKIDFKKKIANELESLLFGRFCGQPWFKVVSNNMGIFGDEDHVFEILVDKDVVKEDFEFVIKVKRALDKKPFDLADYSSELDSYLLKIENDLEHASAEDELSAFVKGKTNFVSCGYYGYKGIELFCREGHFASDRRFELKLNGERIDDWRR